MPDINSSFLSTLRRAASGRQDSQQDIGEFFFRIDAGGPEGATLSTVNSKGKLILPNGHSADPTVEMALEMMKNESRKHTDSLGWSTNQLKSQISLKGNTPLMFMLVQCPNLVGRDMKPLEYDADKARPLLLLSPDEERPRTLRPRLVIENEEGEFQDFSFITDAFILTGNKIRPIAPVGPLYENPEAILSPFDEDLVEPYISVVLSSMDNLNPRYGDRKVVWRLEKAQPPMPAIFFEKVDTDKALYMRVASIIEGLPPEISADFRITVLTSVTEKHIYLQHIPAALSDKALADELDNLLDETFKLKRDRTQIYRDGNLFIFSQEAAGKFLLKQLPFLLKTYKLMGAEKLREFKISPYQPSLNLKMSSGINFLEGEATVDFGPESLTLGQLLRQYRRNKYVTLSDGSRALVEDKYIRRLERIFRPRDGEDEAGVEVSFFDIPELQKLLDGEDLPAFEHSREFYTGLGRLKQKKLKVPGLEGTLRPYQEEGTKWMEYMAENNFGACLADDMGLGKTIQTIALLLKVCSHKDCGPILIVMPRSLLFNWKSEFEHFAPSLTVGIYHGLARDFEAALKNQIVLTTYAMVRNDLKKFHAIDWEYIILDESQNIKNLAAQTTKSILALKGKHKLALSGTPMENNLSELYSLFLFLNPGMFGTLEMFNNLYAGPIQQLGDREATEALRRKIFPFILRRLKEDVLKDLPDRVDQTMFVEMEDDHKRLYEQRRTYYKQLIEQSIATEGVNKSQMVMLQALSELRRIASVPESLSDGRVHSPKLELLTDQIAQSVANGHKVVVFFNFIAGLELAAEQLQKMGIGVETMTGATTRREQIIRRFQTDPECSVLLMTIKVGGVGLNLTAADIVYIVEPWWNKAAEEQAVNRLHRIGQKATVFTYSLITAGTIEEKIRELQLKKAELFDEIISADSSSSKHISQEDIEFLLS